MGFSGLDRRAVRRLVFFSVLLGASACREASDLPRPATTPAQLRARATTAFESVDLYQPVASPATRIDVYQAPMIYRERPSDQTSLDGELEFGALLWDAGGLALDVARPSVYTLSTELDWGGQTYSQVAFLWFRRGTGGRGIALQGIRVTRDRAGYPAIVEVLEDSSGRLLVYVSEALEEQAGEARGAPLEGRRYSVEPAPGREELLVVHLIGQAGEPLGPILYQAFGSSDVIDLHCRCAPSRIETIGTSVKYELQPLAGVSSEVQDGLLESLGWSPGQPAPGFGPGEAVFLDLRLPALF